MITNDDILIVAEKFEAVGRSEVIESIEEDLKVSEEYMDLQDNNLGTNIRPLLLTQSEIENDPSLIQDVIPDGFIIYDTNDFMENRLKQPVKKKLKEIVLDTRIIELPSGEPAKLRVELVDGSFADVWISATGKYSYHWDRLEINGTIFRYDNAPYKVWAEITTFPHHFHNKNEKSVIDSDLPSHPPELQTKQFLDFLRKTLVSESHKKTQK